MSEDLYRHRAERERRARHAAEYLLEAKSSELYAANQTLQRQSDQMNAVLAHVAAGILVTDPKGRIELVNPAARAIFCPEGGGHLEGLGVDQLIGQRPVRPTQKPVFVECVGQRLSGAPFPAEVAAVPLELEGRSGAVWIWRDLTERKRAEAERAELERELRHRQKLDSLGTLASGIAHEINTPVQYVSDNVAFLGEGFRDLLALIDVYRQLGPALAEREPAHPLLAQIAQREQDVDLDFLRAEIPAAVDQSRDGLGQIIKIVAAIRDFSHPGTAEPGRLDLNQAIQNTLTVCRNQWKYVARVDTELDPSLPWVACQPGDFNQVMLNLIVNAAHAVADAKAGQGLGVIRIVSRQQGGQAVVSVEDDGCGIDPGHLERIFDPFFTTKEAGRGTEIGRAHV